jgi:FlaA1/EpsC-like NDP-sugar epimerase
MVRILHRYMPGRLVILLFTENALILVGLWLVASLQVHLLGGGNAGYANGPLGVALTLVCQLSFYYADLYDLRVLNSVRQVLGRMLIARGAVSLLLAAVIFLSPQIHVNTGVLEVSFSAIILVALLWRLLLDVGMRSFAGGERILLLGSGTTVAVLAREIYARSDPPLTLVGSVGEDSFRQERVLPHVPCVGTLAKLNELIDKVKPDRVVLALEDRRQYLPIDTLLERRLRGLVVEEASALYQKLTGRIPIESIRSSELMFS